MIEKFTPEEIELIEKELAEQKEKLKKRSIFYIRNRLEPLRDYCRKKSRELASETGAYITWHKDGYDIYENVKLNIFNLCRVKRIQDIPECDIDTAIEYGKKMADQNFEKLKRRLLNDNDTC